MRRSLLVGGWRKSRGGDARAVSRTVRAPSNRTLARDVPPTGIISGQGRQGSWWRNAGVRLASSGPDSDRRDHLAYRSEGTTAGDAEVEILGRDHESPQPSDSWGLSLVWVEWQGVSTLGLRSTRAASQPGCDAAHRPESPSKYFGRQLRIAARRFSLARCRLGAERSGAQRSEECERA